MNSRFSTAVHILTLLASAREERMKSEFIALSIGTNPVVIRRQLALLREARLVQSKGARGGGWELMQDPVEITLRRVRDALGPEAALRMHKNEPHPKCVVGQNVRAVLEDVYEDAERAMMKRLDDWTLADVLRRVRRAAGSSKPELD